MASAHAFAEDPRNRSWRGTTFRVVAALLAFVYLVAFQGLEAIAAPWIVFPDPIDHGWPRTPELHRLSDAQSGALFAILFAGCLLSLLWRPKEKPALVQFYAATSVFILLSSVPFGASNDSGENFSQVIVGTLVMFLVLVAPLVAAYPAFRSLPRLSGGGFLSRPLLALGAPIVALLLIWVLGVARWHYAGGYIEGPLEEDWMSAVYAGFALALAISLVVARAPGFGTLGVLAGATLAYLGVASAQLPHYPGSWGLPGGALAIVCGIAFAAVAVSEARRLRRPPAETGPPARGRGEGSPA